MKQSETGKERKVVVTGLNIENCGAGDAIESAQLEITFILVR